MLFSFRRFCIGLSKRNVAPFQTTLSTDALHAPPTRPRGLLPSSPGATPSQDLCQNPRCRAEACMSMCTTSTVCVCPSFKKYLYSSLPGSGRHSLIDMMRAFTTIVHLSDSLRTVCIPIPAPLITAQLNFQSGATPNARLTRCQAQHSTTAAADGRTASGKH